MAAPGEAELRTAIALTRAAQFDQAIPHFLAAQGHVTDEYALKFNLALCYVATGEPGKAIPLLESLPNDPRRGANADNLLAQAYIGNGQSDEALRALERAAQKAPKDEKQYLFIADACMASADYGLGVRAMDLGLSHLPRSAEMHYERGMFLSLLDEFDQAKQEFTSAAGLAQGHAIGYLAAAQKSFFEGNIAEAVRVAREAVQHKQTNYLLLAFLGDALLRNGAVPGQADFTEARAALEKSIRERPDYADSRIALAKVELLDGHVDQAVEQLRTAQQLQPRSAAVYANLAAAYRKKGDAQNAAAALAVLNQINQEQAARIGSAPGDRKAGYAQHPLP